MLSVQIREMIERRMVRAEDRIGAEILVVEDVSNLGKRTLWSAVLTGAARWTPVAIMELSGPA